VAELIETATTDPGQFDHAVQRARDDRTQTRTLAGTTAEMLKHGFTVLDQLRYYETEHTRIRDLRTTTGDRVTVSSRVLHARQNGKLCGLVSRCRVSL